MASRKDELESWWRQLTDAQKVDARTMSSEMPGWMATTLAEAGAIVAPSNWKAEPSEWFHLPDDVAAFIAQREPSDFAAPWAPPTRL